MVDERRREPREPVEYLATLVTGRDPRYCLVTELSDGGVRISAVRYSIPDEFGLRTNGNAIQKRYKVVWRIGHYVCAVLIAADSSPAPNQPMVPTTAL